MINLLRLLFVPKCLLCGAVLSDTDADAVFCPKCRLEYEKLKHTPCPICGKRQTLCRHAPAALAGVPVTHLFAFDSPLSRKLIYTLKRQNRRSLQRFFARELSEAAEIPEDAVVSFAPRTPKNVRLYGFDQAREMAKALARDRHLPLVSLFRHAGRREQKTLDAAGRAENAEKSYVLRRGCAGNGRTLVLLDDVITTGSTLSRLVSLAREAGYGKILVFSVARTQLQKEPPNE